MVSFTAVPVLPDRRSATTCVVYMPLSLFFNFSTTDSAGRSVHAATEETGALWIDQGLSPD